jgi:hypothetical protein
MKKHIETIKMSLKEKNNKSRVKGFFGLFTMIFSLLLSQFTASSSK